ncbi:hypothetical protein PQX77_001806, partial [Marasmius sp. AFHP31]
MYLEHNDKRRQTNPTASEGDLSNERPGQVPDILKNTGLTAVNMTRKECVKKETGRWLALMDRLLKQEAKLRSKEFEAISCLKMREGTGEEFGLDCRDPSLENIFVDEQDPTKITCIIDWESTTTRPLWQVKMAADVSAQTSSSNCIKSQSSDPLPSDFGTLAHEWSYYEAAGMRLRMAHRFVEWGKAWQRDAWLGRVRRRVVEGGGTQRVDSALLCPVPESVNVNGGGELLARVSNNGTVPLNAVTNGGDVEETPGESSPSDSSSEDSGLGVGRPPAVKALNALAARRKATSSIPIIAQETEKGEISA